MTTRHRFNVLLGMFLLTCGIAWCNTASGQQPAISIERIRGDVKYLASAPLLGRGIGSRGEELAIDFIANQFEKAGLKPVGDRGTYFQAVPLVMVTTGPKATLAMLKGDQATSFK